MFKESRFGKIVRDQEFIRLLDAYFSEVITPTYGAEVIADPGLEGTYVGGLCNGLTNGSGGPSQSSDSHGGLKAQKSAISAAFGYIRVEGLSIVTGNWYRAAAYIKRLTGATGDNTPLYYDADTGYCYAEVSTNHEYTLKEITFHSLGTRADGEFRISSSAAGAGWDSIVFDDISFRQIITSSMFFRCKTSVGSNFDSGATFTPKNMNPGGLVVSLDSTLVPQNYVLVYIQKNDSMPGSYLHVDKCVGGAYTVLLGGVTQPVTLASGAELEVKKIGTSYKIYYNRLLISTQVIADAGIVSNTLHGQFSSSPRVIFSGFRVKELKNIYCIGDSRTAGAAEVGYVPMVFGTYETPTRYAFAGWTIATVKAGIDAELAGAVGTPDYVLINMGVNDANVGTAEGPFKSDYAYVLNALNAKWPNAKIYVARFWMRGFTAACTTYWNYIQSVVATHSHCYLGPSEATTIENGDDGVTYTVDGLHYNSAGIKVWATAWEAVLSLPLVN